MSTGGAVSHTFDGVKAFHRAEEAEDLLTAVQGLIATFIRSADESSTSKSLGITTNVNKDGSTPRTVLIDQKSPSQLEEILPKSLPQEAQGREVFLQTVSTLLQYSVNTWDQGFLDKLYSTSTPVGLASDLLLSALNTNSHVFAVSPALTLLEKTTARQLANMFGLNSPWAGGVSQPGGSAANAMSITVARNVLFPETKTQGLGGRKFVIFTSAHGHYSVEKAAQMQGFGSEAVRGVEVDGEGRMRADELERRIVEARDKGEVPFYVNATAGTTVLGSYDPLNEISDVCKKYNLWMHVDGSWGAPIIFSDKQKHKLSGIEKADSISLCPHKMLNVPLTCSFLLGKDIREFHKGMTLPAGYLFHTSEALEEEGDHYYDLADLTPQCGRRADSLKMALAWIYHGTEGFRDSVDNAFEAASHLAGILAEKEEFELVSSNPPPCLQVCFYYKKTGDSERNSETTRRIVEYLVPRGFMTDYAPGPQGKFFRVVVNGLTRTETVEGLVRGIEQAGEELKIV